jgi:predicted outer membrane protein
MFREYWRLPGIRTERDGCLLRETHSRVSQFLGTFLQTRAGRITYVAGLTLVLTALGFWAAVQVGVPTSTLADAAMTDAPFAKNAELVALGNQKFARLAQDKADSDTVRNFASQVLADHAQESDGLQHAAWKENISLPTRLATKDQAAYERLSMLNGSEFDRSYMRYMVRSLTDGLQVFRHEAANGNDQVVRRFASETIPTIENHLNQARLALKKVTPADNWKTVNGTGVPMRKSQKK